MNVSLLDLERYEQGSEAMPFQGRVGMMPVLRWAHGNLLLQHAAKMLDLSLRKTPHMQEPPEDYTPEKVLCVLIGVISIMGMTGASLWFGQRYLRDLWWVPGTLTLAMLYVTYAARYEMQFWYPYDLAHFALFGVACLCLLEGRWGLALLLFAVDTPLRETSIYLVLLSLSVGYARKELKAAAWSAGTMVIIWIPIRVLIAHHFAHNPSDTRIHWLGIGSDLARAKRTP